MNYLKHYNTLIFRAKWRKLEGYVEKHHAIPRCLGGTNDAGNLVKLTAEEHFVAHQLLVKIYPENENLIFALILMSGLENKKRCVNKLYGWIRKKVSVNRTGVPKTESHKEKLRICNLGKIQSESTKNKRSLANTGHTVSEETRNKIRESLKGVKHSKERIDKMAVSKTGSKQSKKTIEKRINSNKGKIRSEQSRINISNGRKGMKFSEEHKNSLSLSKMGIKLPKDFPIDTIAWVGAL